MAKPLGKLRVPVTSSTISVLSGMETDALGVPLVPACARKVAGMASQLVAQWDRSSRSQRIDLLSRFVARHRDSTSAELEKALGPASMLFFTRITTWLRLSYQLRYELSVQLSALSIFLQSQRFLTNFTEIGGIEMLTDILCFVRGDCVEDRHNALLLLVHLANSGRVYRELVCDCGGIDRIVRAAQGEREDKTLELYTSLFLALGQGNPRKASLVHAGLIQLMLSGNDESALAAASTLRALQMSKDQSDAASGQSGVHAVVVGAENGSPEETALLLDALFTLLRSESVKLRFEGTELLGLVSRSVPFLAPIVERCVRIIDTVPMATDSMTPVQLRRLQLSCGRALCAVLLQPMPAEARRRLLLMTEARGGHMALIKYLSLCDTRHGTSAEEACHALRLLCLVPAIDAGAHTIAGIENASRTARYLSSCIGRDLLEEVLQGETMERAQVLALVKALAEPTDETDLPALPNEKPIQNLPDTPAAPNM